MIGLYLKTKSSTVGIYYCHCCWLLVGLTSKCPQIAVCWDGLPLGLTHQKQMHYFFIFIGLSNSTLSNWFEHLVYFVWGKCCCTFMYISHVIRNDLESCLMITTWVRTASIRLDLNAKYVDHWTGTCWFLMILGSVWNLDTVGHGGLVSFSHECYRFAGFPVF